MSKKILVPLDGSHEAEEVLCQVKEIAGLTGFEICLMKVLHIPEFPGVASTHPWMQVVREIEDYLQRVQERLEREGFRVSHRICKGDAAEEILGEATHADVEMVAMRTHGRTGLARLALGSVSEQVLRHSQKPVLLVKVEKAKAA
jgi:nucleotide-binding universal stress UspA family protein